jgi:hypothetical protein
MDLAQDSLKNAVGSAVLSKTLDAAAANADGLLRLMATADPARAPLPEGSGGAVDIVV